MQYLGALSGEGRLTSDGESFTLVEYDFEGFITKAGHMTGGGEIRSTPAHMREFFARGNVRLMTDDGIEMSLRFTQKKLIPDDGSAHVDVVGDLPPASAWHH